MPRFHLFPGVHSQLPSCPPPHVIPQSADLAGVKAILPGLNALDIPANAEVVIAPSALHVSLVKEALKPEIGLAVQDIHTAKGLGAFTGSHTAAQVKDFGVGWVLVGHSERRSLFGETDAQTGEKVRVALDAGLKVILCVGESLAEREAGATMEVILRQMAAGTARISAAEWSHIVVAYEPVWAIGTGRVATAEQAEEAHAGIRAWARDTVGAEVADATRIIYGGSVNGGNCGGLIGQPNIDGFLVGGASLKPEFLDIVKSAAVKA